VVSHSAGSIISDVALSMAGNAQYHPKLGKVDFIAKHIRAHIALNGAISGSPWATMALGAAGASATSPLCIGANLYLKRPAGSSCTKYATLYGTILADLHPPYMQARWRPLVHLATVPTITVAGGSHETLFPFKIHFVPGLDDGVVPMDSSCGRDVIRSHWPSGSTPLGLIGLARAFDLGMALTDQQPLRAAIEYREQLGPHRDGMPRLAAACTPFKTPWGMWQLVVPSPQTFNYFTHHYPFIQTAENHGYTEIFLDERDDMIGRARPELEDTRAIINPMLYQLDVVNPAVKTMQVEFHKGRRIRFPLTRRYMWLWRRTYHRMQGWQTRSAADYVYDYVR
jgi:hypothetical protein